MRKGQTAAVIKSLTQLTRQRPQLAQAHLLLADAYRIEGNLEGTLGVYRRLLELNPKDPQPPLLIGLVLLQQNKRAEARKSFEKSLEQAPDYLLALEQLVELDVADKQYAGALQRVRTLIEKFPKAAELQLFLARIYDAQGETTEAEAALQKAVELQPNYRPAYLALAKIYVRSNRYQQALEKLTPILRHLELLHS